MMFVLILILIHVLQFLKYPATMGRLSLWFVSSSSSRDHAGDARQISLDVSAERIQPRLDVSTVTGISRREGTASHPRR